MQLLLVRHGLPESEVRTDGTFADPPLSEIGKKQAELAGEWLAEFEPQQIYSSPMVRALQTAEPIAAAAGLSAGHIAVREGLTEFDKTATSYVPMEIMKHTDRERWNELAEGSFDPGNSAAVVAWVQEVIDEIEQIVDNHPGEQVAVVCHGGVINAYLAHCLGFDKDKFLRFDVDYTSLTRVLASRQGHRRVFAINDRTHLRGYPDLILGS